MTEMTKREFFKAVMALENVDAELKLFAEKEIEKMDERNAKRKARPSKAQIANEPIKAQILKYLESCTEWTTASEIAEHVEISTQKASALCRQLIADEHLISEEIKVKGKGKVKGYKILV